MKDQGCAMGFLVAGLLRILIFFGLAIAVVIPARIT